MYELEVRSELRARRSMRPLTGEGTETFTIRLKVGAERSLGAGERVVEFAQLEQVLRRALDDLEGKRLPDLDVFSGGSVSLENLAQFLFRKVKILLDTSRVRPLSVAVEVAEGRRVAYRE